MGRTRTDEIPAGTWDVIVIGAGINGASSARELVRAGYSVLLVDRGDFAAGASSRSSRILHCGLRYFEAPRPVRTFLTHPRRLADACRMARAAMQAREELARVEPERCRPVRMCFPVYRDGAVHGWHLDTGFAALRRLGPGSPPLDYCRVSSGLSTRLPFADDLRPEGLQSIATYREYLIDWPERLCVDAALEAEHGGATVRTFCEARIVGRGDDGLWTVRLDDRVGECRGEVRARNVLNMAGPWIDRVNPARENAGTVPRQVRGTKGVHIAVRLPERYRGCAIAALNRASEPFYCLPLHDDLYYFGPTETPFDDDPATVRPEEEDIQWLLAEARHLLPGLALERADVEFAWAGVRPLTHDPDQPMGRRSREIFDGRDFGCPGLYSMTGGPVMSHLSGARDVVRAIGAHSGPGGRSVAEPAAPAVGHRETPSCTPDTAEETRKALYRQAVTAEHARDLKGVVYTRTGEAWRARLSRDYLETVANSIADLLAWSPERVAAEVEEVIEYQNAAERVAERRAANDGPRVYTEEVSS